MDKIYIYTLFSVIYLSLSALIFYSVPITNKHLDIDSPYYEKMGNLFYEKNSVSEQNNNLSISQQPLGYPLFIGIIYKIFGRNINFIILFQILLSLLSGFLIASITRKLFGEIAALISFIFFSINLGFLVFPQFILAETLTTLFLIVFFERLVDFHKTNKLISLSCSGLFLGTSNLFKPAAIYFIFPLILIMFFMPKINIKSKIKYTSILLTSFLIPIIGYMSYNKITYDKFQFTPLGNYNLYIRFWSKVDGGQKPFSTPQEHLKNISESSNKIEKLMDQGGWDLVKNEFWENIKENTFLFIKAWLKDVAKTFFGLYSTNLKLLLEPNIKGGEVSFFYSSGTILDKIHKYISMGTESLILISVGYAETIWSLIRYMLCLIALIFMFIKRQYFIFSIFLVYIFYFSFITGFDGCSRYRMMFEFLLIILSSQGISLIIQNMKPTKTG